MPSRPIYPDDSVSTPDDNQWFPLVDLNTSVTSDQNRRMSGGWLLAALRNPVVYSVSGVPDAATVVTLTYVCTEALRIPTDPEWYSYCEDGPAAPLDVVVKKVVSGSVSTVGNVTIATDGTVSASPSWATQDLAAGDAVIIVITFDGTMGSIGLGFSAQRIP